MKRVAYKVEPVLHIHRYVVAIINDSKKSCSTNYKFCANRKDVARVKAEAPKGAVIEVYRASHNFLNAWHKG